MLKIRQKKKKKKEVDLSLFLFLKEEKGNDPVKKQKKKER